jgi:glycine hydroxymethyltransferase
MKMGSEVERLLEGLVNHERSSSVQLNLIPSENVLSPLARLPFVLDLHTRYFLNDFQRFGKWYFPAGKPIGELEAEILLPLLQEFTRAEYVNVRPISGMNCMLIAVSALAKPGDTVFSLPFSNGGHASTPEVLNSLGLHFHPISFENAFNIDLEKLRKDLTEQKPALVYIDQSTFLFPIDLQPIRQIINEVSPETWLHYDSSHTNGLIFGGVLPNPLDQGADCFGGSTHKTLPGPHKGFLATRNSIVAKKIDQCADHLVSHHHSSSSWSLAITLLEMKYCDGAEYAKNTILNTQILAKTLYDGGFFVAAADQGFTACHQIWVHPSDGEMPIEDYLKLLTELGVMTNLFDGLPGISQPAFRLSLSEATRLGATAEDAKEIGLLLIEALKKSRIDSDLLQRVKKLTTRLSKPHYCFQLKDVEKTLSSSGKLTDLMKTLEGCHEHHKQIF